LSIRLTFLISQSGKENTKVFLQRVWEIKIIGFEIYFGGSQKLKVPFIVDNTVASPYLLTQSTWRYYCDSFLTKYIAGNGTSLEA
jgi:O-acetylhomoserine (thiol)-lyase